MQFVVLPRSLATHVDKLLRAFPVVVVTGARQTGKTTLVRQLSPSEGRTYATLDDPTCLEAAVRDPEGFLGSLPRATLDEVQRRPEVLLAVKRIVDRRRSAGSFLLTGSANLMLMARVSESLAGRAIYVNLRPLTETEKIGRPDPGPWHALLRAEGAQDASEIFPRSPAPPWSWGRAVLEGGFPVPTQERDPEARRAWFEGYVSTYVERDLRQLAQVEALIDFRRLMRISALRTGRLANQAELARDAGLSHATAHRYLNLLEASFLIARVPPYAVSRTKRLTKMPKLQWEDTGLAAHLVGVDSEKQLYRHESSGHLLENLVWHHLRCWADAASPRVELSTWRTASGEEVDFVIECGRHLLPVEVKSAARLSSGDIRHLESFLSEYQEQARFGVILYGGRECRLLSRRVLAVPIAFAVGLLAETR